MVYTSAFTIDSLFINLMFNGPVFITYFISNKSCLVGAMQLHIPDIHTTRY